MGGAPSGLVILAWANVVAGAVAGWGALFGLVDVVRVGGGASSIVPIWIVAVAQVVGGLGLAELRWWARRCLLYCAAWRLALLAASIATSGIPPSWTTILTGESTSFLVLFDLWRLVATALALVTAVHLLRPRVRALFAQPPHVGWITVDGSAVGLAILLALAMRHPPTAPQVARRPYVAPAPKPIEPGVGAATLVPTYDGQPIDDFAADEVQLRLTPLATSGRPADATTGQAIGGPLEPRWRVRRGRIRIAAVPAGAYQLRLTIDRNRANASGEAGDLTALVAGTVELRTGHGPATADVPLRYVMALRSPETSPAPSSVVAGGADAGAAVAGGAAFGVPTPDQIERLPHVPPHVVFRWDAVPRAADYMVTVFCGHELPPRQATVSELSWATDLSPCPPPDHWVAGVFAHAHDRRVLGSVQQRAFVVEGTPASRATRGLPPATLTLRPTFEGRALRDVVERDVAFVLRVRGQSTMEPARVRWRVRHGRIKIPKLAPGTYHLTLHIGRDAGARPACRPLPGDLIAPTGFELAREPLHTDWRPESRVLALQRTLQLLEPEGADDGASCSYPAPTHVRSPVVFRWQPVPEAVSYALEVMRPKAARISPAVKTTVSEATWQSTLAPSEPGDFYSLKVVARGRDGGEVALLWHRFVVD